MKLSWIVSASLCALALAGCGSKLSKSAYAPTPTQSLQAATLLEDAKKVATLCTQTFPDSKSFQENLMADGYRLEGIESGLRLLSKNNRSILAASATSAAPAANCGVIVKNMTEEQATDLANISVTAANAKEITLEDTRMREGKVWEGRLKNIPVRIGIVPNRNLTILRGTVVTMLEVK